MGFAQGVSGLNAASNNLDVIGNNVANSGTVGFKTGSVLFADVYAGSRVGLGTHVAGITQNFTQGAVQTSTRALDMAITGGDGFFRLASPSGEISYSRNGQFNVDKDNYIVSASGLRLTGYPVTASGTLSGGNPTALQLPQVAMAPKSTTAIVSQFNLDSRSAVPIKTPFDATDSTTYNYPNATTVFDSLGNSHEISTYFVKTGANAWSMYATADGWPLDANGAKVAPDATDATKPSSGGAALSAIAFDTNGKLAVDAAGQPTSPAGGKINFAGLDFGNGSTPLAFSMDITSTSQFGNVSEAKNQNQNGYTSGTLTAFAINPDGTVTGKYSNEQTKSLGQIVLSAFANPDGLVPTGDNGYSETAASGQPLTGAPGVGSKVGALRSGALEASNVDLTSELVNMIIAQRTYQANAQTVKTQDQVMQTLVSMR
ncbi:flagellar hook protein FlgE [Glaciimonas sp. Gout2]|uniref:flagellar hook protein FlgE n=1 Tax=unclassified Glaciimonas TaxID=2644401 RepID=UPI002B232D22|nr:MULTISPECIES: flagellar hook protein FlgE [unclassified Glaciimonas]MEB0013894.1 flagellar hook protein FlgE [Glaciimonas sp. Cout2]MEB0083829.1 flagellar hook protein FlgE [Glaciimonas sp. Gout2]